MNATTNKLYLQNLTAYQTSEADGWIHREMTWGCQDGLLITATKRMQDSKSIHYLGLNKGIF